MKLLFSLVILMIACASVSANSIDKLQTVHDVNLFLAKAFPKYGLGSLLDEKAVVSTEFGKNKFYKLDLDGNGLTDLVVDGSDLIAVLNAGGERYSYHYLDLGSSDIYVHTLVNIVKGPQPMLVLRGFNSEAKIVLAKETEKTIIYKFGEFIEHNPEPDRFKIRKIAFETTGCFGTCPVLKMRIDERRRATYHAIQYNERKGNFTGVISPEAYKKLVDTINYLGLKQLKDNYMVGHTDDETMTLAITFDDGQVKKISDYGAEGTFGLANLYKQFYDLGANQRWRRSSGQRR